MKYLGPRPFIAIYRSLPERKQHDSFRLYHETMMCPFQIKAAISAVGLIVLVYRPSHGVLRPYVKYVLRDFYSRDQSVIGDPERRESINHHPTN